MSRRAGVAAVAVFVALAACGLSVSGTRVGGGDAAAPPPPPALPEAGPPSDASGDDASVDATTLPGCAGTHALCDDFDLGLDAGRWTGSTLFNGGTLALSPDAESPPNALEIAVPARSGNNVYASLDKVVNATITHIVCAFDVFPAIREPMNGEYVDVIDITFAPSVIGQNEHVRIRLRTLGDSLLEYGGYMALAYSVTALGTGAWRHLVLDADLAKSSITVEVDGVKTTQSPTHTVTVATSATIHFGVADSFSFDGSLLRYDNVVCDVTP